MRGGGFYDWVTGWSAQGLLLVEGWADLGPAPLCSHLQLTSPHSAKHYLPLERLPAACGLG